MKHTPRLSSLAVVAVLGSSFSLNACREMPMNGPEASVMPDATERRDTGGGGGNEGGMMMPDAMGPGPDATMMGSEGGMSGEGGVMARMVTLRQLQDPMDSMHPAAGTRVTLMDTGLVALTERVLIGSSRGSGMPAQCRFAVWIGRSNGGDFSGIQVQELLNLGMAADCFAVMPNRIPANVMPGQPVMAVTDATYGEFCSGPTGTMPGMCSDFEQSQLFLGGTARITFGMGGSAPMPTDVSASDIVGMMGVPGARGKALDGVLVRLRNVKVVLTRQDGSMFNDYAVAAMDDTMNARSVDLVISNFRNTSCVRSHLDMRGTMTLPSITGVVLPDFGRWSLRLRNENDIEGLMCAPRDGGTGGMDSGM